VTVPDGSTIILGGMLRLNQSKGGNKVPILGDLPIIGIPFRSISNTDSQSKLYIFVKAEVIRPSDGLVGGGRHLNRLSDQNREAFKQHEAEFQDYENLPGIKPRPVDPEKILDSR
jgi:general secretion pathway protein D